MRLLILSLLLIGCNADQSETTPSWSEHHRLNDFGEPTEETYHTSIVNGTKNGYPCEVHFMKSDSSLYFHFEQNGREQVVNGRRFQTLKAYVENGSELHINLYLGQSLFADRDGSMYSAILNNEQLDVFINLSKLNTGQGDWYQFTVNRNWLK